jgi:AraC-like DNA-binding protein
LHEIKFRKNIEDIVLQNISDTNFGVCEISQLLGMSRSQLFRKLKETLNISPSDYIRIIRLNEAKRRLKLGEMNVNEIADECGFASSSYFITSFRKHFGVTPGDFTKN